MVNVAHNLPALSAYTTLNATSLGLQKSIRKLSTGLRISSAADDAAGLAISEKMRAQVRGLDMAVRNSQDGVSMLQTAEGALGSTHSILQRMRELAVQASNDTLNSQDRRYIQEEVGQLIEEIDRIGNTTQFNKKKLLDGSGAVLWSSSSSQLRAVVNGPIPKDGSFVEGNYEIDIKTENAGAAEVQKSGIFMYSEPPSYEQSSVNVLFIIDESSSMGGAITTVANNIRSFVQNIRDKGVDDIEIGVSTYNESFHSKAYPDGSLWSNDPASAANLLNGLTVHAASVDPYNAVIKAVEEYGGSFHENGQYGSYEMFANGPRYFQNRYIVIVTDTRDEAHASSRQTAIAALKGGDEAKDDIELSVIAPETFKSDYEKMVTETGGMFIPYVSNGSWGSTLNSGLGGKIGEQATLPPEQPPFDDTYMNKVVQGLSDGISIFDDGPRTLTLHQGDRSVNVTVDASDTIETLADKLNDAIGLGLGNADLTGGDGRFATYVGRGQSTDLTSESVEGTIVLRSAVAGKAGRITFSGDDTLINALGFNTIQEAQEATRSATIRDAHTGKTIVSSQKFTGNKIVGALGGAIDIDIDSTTAMGAAWDANGKRFHTTAQEFSGVLHISENSTVLQIGANEGETMTLEFGDMRSRALGLDEVRVTDRESAARAITVIDNAIDHVSTQRSKLGAYQNRLEHTVNNLTTAGENLTASESRIRDADMAKEMMEFSKLQIMLQAGNSMLAQANQLPQNVLNLLR